MRSRVDEGMHARWTEGRGRLNSVMFNTSRLWISLEIITRSQMVARVEGGSGRIGPFGEIDLRNASEMAFFRRRGRIPPRAIQEESVAASVVARPFGG